MELREKQMTWGLIFLFAGGSASARCSARRNGEVPATASSACRGGHLTAIVVFSLIAIVVRRSPATRRLPRSSFQSQSAPARGGRHTMPYVYITGAAVNFA